MNITFVVIVTLEAKIFEAKYATPIFSRGPIGHSTKKLGAHFTAKSARGRPARIAELPRSKFDPELFPHSAYVEIFVTFATKVPYLTFCKKM